MPQVVCAGQQGDPTSPLPAASPSSEAVPSAKHDLQPSQQQAGTFVAAHPEVPTSSASPCSPLAEVGILAITKAAQTASARPSAQQADLDAAAAPCEGRQNTQSCETSKQSLQQEQHQAQQVM